jgi:cytochrome c oxidase subunit 2
MLLIDIYCDVPSKFFELTFQEPATPTMDGIFLFNSHLLFLIINIVLLIWWLILIIVLNFFDQDISKIKIFNHSNILEIIWTTIPAIILLSLAGPSFSLLYSLDELINPNLTLKIIGHQWYWSYEIGDYKFCSLVNKEFKFSCYLLTNDFLKDSVNLGLFRLLETNKRIILPTNLYIRLLVTAVDVLHSWTVPSFGIKVDACPGRLTQINLFIKRSGIFFGQCSEICGVNHGFMPIVIISCSLKHFYFMILNSK